MRDYLNFYMNYVQIQSTVLLNSLWFWLRRLPLIGKKISPKFYQMIDLKTALLILLKWLYLPITIIKKGLLIFLAWLIAFLAHYIVSPGGNQLLNPSNFTAPEVFNWTITIFLFFCLFERLNFLDASGKTLFNLVDFAKIYQLSYSETLKKYYRINLVISSLAYLVPLFLFGWFYHQILIAIILPFACRLLFLNISMIIAAQAFWLKVIDWLHGEIVRWIYGFSILIIGGFAVIYFTIFQTIVWTNLVTLTIALLAVFSYFWVNRIAFKQGFIQRIFIKQAYRDEAYAKAKTNQGSTGILAAQRASQKIEATDESALFNRYSGIQLLNHLLFKRYQKVFSKKLLWRLGFLIGLLLIIIGFYFYLTMTNSQNMLIMDSNQVAKALPSLFPIVYILNLSKEIVAIYYLKCDKAMLNYPFYRTKSAILGSFLDRLKQSFIVNTPIIIGIFLNIFAIILLFGENISPAIYGLIIFYGIAMNLLFSFHELFLYYILQPFDREGKAKNPAFQFINWIFYFFCIYNYNVEGFFNSTILYVLIISIVIVLYVGLGLMMVRLKAPKTFRLK
ncbi:MULTISPECIES: hypothetical protein [unclassified Enterococcus]|uniref:hypothetical protein n=1 Tax=unclassified Enterococcus TaxID=2608891 RepID=UPI001552F4B9|nr:MULTISPECIES: hypothetical protein [unclassified Enterococcus]MBS7577243.1 hypothetical protein [Enterococcus sp. MMGLQ5-2]MBS7584664.1 hypothetical protein [Enterococcus sp. MMGLQ5-1]NPD12519.1 hypothetical protein [Enterococcus sp. MMGLQ5-1]NPD37077.1 hypothetical protein [Enterococcus sp. MMGLQ5-2]